MPSRRHGILRRGISRLRASGASASLAEASHDRAADQFGWAAAVIFFVALAVRLLNLWQIRRSPYFTVLMGDARSYDEWAQQIANGDWVGHDVFYQAPLYPYFLGVLYRVVGRSLFIVRLCQAAIGSLACVLLGLAGWRLFSKPTGLLAGLILALYAPAVFFDGLIQKSVLDVFFVCLMLWLVASLATENAGPGIRKPRSFRKARWFWLGVTVGGLSLTRENALLFVVVVLAWAAFSVRKTPAVVGFLFGVTIVLLPVVVRNHFVGGGVYLTTAQFGPNFYIGNNPRSDGTYMPLRFGRGAPEYERQDATELAEQALARRLDAAEVSAYWTNRALSFIRSQPIAWLKLIGRKVVLLANATEVLDTESQYSYAEWSAPIRFGEKVGHFGLLLPLALFGVLATRQSGARLRVFLVLALTYAASVIVFYVFARYRFPIVPFLVLLAAAGLAMAGSYFQRISPSRGTVTIASVAGVAFLANWPLLSVDLMRAVSETNLAVALQSDGRVEEATSHYRRAIALRPDYAPAYNNLGSALRANGRANEAVAVFERALVLQPDYAEAHYNAGNAFVELGKTSQAIDHFKRALQLNPGSADAHNNLGIALVEQGRLDEAIVEFNAVIGVDANSAKAHRNLGDALASKGATELAIHHLRQAVRLEPTGSQAHYDLGSILLEAGQLDEAIAEFRSALTYAPSSPETHNNLGIALGSLGKLDEAIAHFQEALRIRPGFEDARRNLALALRAQQRPVTTR
jgi:tetratricopeptide (TPR) repeat protein